MKMKIKWIIVMTVAAFMFAPFAWAQQETIEDQSGQQTQQMQQGEEATPPGYQEGAQTRDIGVEQVVSWVTHPQFQTWIMQFPDMADQIAQVPYAANLFYQSQNFRRWSENYPDRALNILNAAVEWQAMSQTEKTDFFRQHPNLRGGPEDRFQQGRQESQRQPLRRQETDQMPREQQGQEQQPDQPQQPDQLFEEEQPLEEERQQEEDQGWF